MKETPYNELVDLFIIDDFVDRKILDVFSFAPSNMYSVVSSVETINSGRRGNTAVPHAPETRLSNISSYVGTF